MQYTTLLTFWGLFFGFLTACNHQPLPQQQSAAILPTTVSSPDSFIDDIPILDSIINPTRYNLVLEPKGNYSSIKTAIANEQKRFRNQYFNLNTATQQDSLIQEASTYITETLVNEIIPHWYGTTWSFSGYTAAPNEGEVGCSYFVSTTLLHAAFRVNRYKLAQQGPQHEAKSLQLDSIHLVENTETTTSIYSYMKENFDEGIFFVGLDHSHVGYLLYRKKQLFFIQSSYGIPNGVIIEKIEFSEIFKWCSVYSIAEISTNKKLIEYWVKYQEIPIIKGKE